jgi:hypothetical protein
MNLHAQAGGGRATTMSEAASPMPAPAALAYVVGIDIGMESCMMCCLTMEKRQVIKPSQFNNDAAGFEWFFTHLEQVKSAPQQILVGLEATSRYGENLYHALVKRGYRVCLLHPGQIHAFARASRAASENGPVGCDHDCPGFARDREARFGSVRSRGSGHLSRSRALAATTHGGYRPLQK